MSKEPTFKERVALLEQIVTKQTDIMKSMFERLQMVEEELDKTEAPARPALILPERMN